MGKTRHTSSRRRHEALFERTRDGVLFVDPQRRIVDGNAAAVELLGRSLEQLRGTELSELVDAEARDHIEIGWGLLLKTGTISGEVRIPYKGVERLVDGHAVAHVADGLHLIVFRDVTEQRRLDEQRRQSQKLESIGRLAGGIAHDFNNFLTAILGYSQLVAEDVKDDAESAAHVREVLDAAERASGLTQQLLLFSRREAVERTSLDLAEVIGSMETGLKRLIGEHIELLAHTEPGLPPVYIHRTDLEQVILNLAVNAREAMPEGGRLTIEARSAPFDAVPPGVTMLSPSDGGYVRLTVADEGQGMTTDILERIFEPFFTTQGADKNGLGLATVFGVVKQHEGWIDVFSGRGRGTRFEVLLPVSKTTRETPAKIQEPALDEARSGKILLVEADFAILDLARKVLTRAGYAVLSTTDGDDALRIGAEHAGEIRLLITNLVLPGMTGRQLAERLATRIRQLRVLYVSGYTDDVLEGLVGNGYTAAFLQKPFNVSSLVSKTVEVMEEHVAETNNA